VFFVLVYYAEFANCAFSLSSADNNNNMSQAVTSCSLTG